ncbi:zinc-binding dehydrogenase [Pseudarthrobacter sp. Y6]|uniref:zinc-binding dehydrogenase n=1 Tax=Pseudarthrobacter sp. Y6 TaxID=3418422 RepID=UPI003CE8B427
MAPVLALTGGSGADVAFEMMSPARLARNPADPRPLRSAAAGVITPAVETFALVQAAEAHGMLEAGHTAGRLILKL